MRFIKAKALRHGNTVAESEPSWGSLDKTKIPRIGHADQGDPDKKSTWKYPHHWVSGGSALDDNGVYTDGTLYLHKGGLNAAWAAAMGARSGQQASNEVIAHLQAHREALGLDDKSEDFCLEEKNVELQFSFKQSKEEFQVVYGEVYAPNHVDTDWETMTAEEIREMAWNFLATKDMDNIDINHNLEKSGCYVVESFIARANDPDGFNEGAWVLGVRCTDDIWKQVKKGELNGFSLYGTVKKFPAKVLIEVAKQIAGVTETSTIDIIPYHEHTFIVNLNKSGRIVSGKTDIVQGHFHVITKSTATENELDHSHRIFLE